MNNPLARHLAARFQETVTSHQEIYQDDPKLQIILYIAHTNQEKAVAEKMAANKEAAAAHAEKSQSQSCCLQNLCREGESRESYIPEAG